MKKLLTTLSILLIATVSYAQTTTVERVIDGDTIVVTTPEGKSEEVQLIGIQAPEDEKMGQEATEFVKELIEGKEIRLEFDVQERDKYGRLLAYVHIQPEGLKELKTKESGLYAIKEPFINAIIMKMGYATPMTIPPNVKYADLFKELYVEAEEAGRGLWRHTAKLKDEDWVRNNIINLLRSSGIEAEIKNISMPLDKLEKYSPLMTYEVCFDDKCLLVHYDYDKWFLHKDVMSEGE